MITIDDNTKNKLSQFLDSDGHIIISDDMPEDLKMAIKYMNDNNINLLSEISEDADIPELDEENEDLDDVSVVSEASNTNFTPVGTPNYISENVSEDEVKDLEDLF